MGILEISNLKRTKSRNQFEFGNSEIVCPQRIFAGGNELGNRDWGTHCSIIIDPGFNVGRLRSYSWLNRYLGLSGCDNLGNESQPDGIYARWPPRA